MSFTRNLLTYIPQTKEVYTFCFYEKAFTTQECRRAIELGGTRRISTIGAHEFDKKIRYSRNVPIRQTQKSQWLYEKIAKIVEQCNLEAFQFNLTGFTEPLHINEYNIGQYYNWHRDIGHKISTRKISLVVLLSKPSAYEGGNLEFSPSERDEYPREQGTVILFPSYSLHRVAPVTRGRRMTLAGWVNGPPFV